MSGSIQPRLREFAKTVLERRGALVDWPQTAPEGLAVLPPAAAALGGVETLRLSYQPGENRLCVNLAAEFPERLRPLLEAEPCIGLFHIPGLYLKKAAMDEPVARAFTWQNARVKVIGSEPDRIEYHTWHFQVALDSYERWEELFSITVNAASGAEVVLPDMLGQDILSLCGPPDPAVISAVNGHEAPGPRVTFQYATRRLLVNVHERAAQFISRLEAGLQRDRKRIREYYHALLRDTKTPRERENPASVGQEDKRRAVELELRRKTAELDERYAIKAVITPHILVRLNMPVLAVKCEVFRKQTGGVHTIYWNPLTKALEPIRCSGCGDGIFSVFFSESGVKPLCAACFGK